MDVWPQLPDGAVSWTGWKLTASLDRKNSDLAPRTMRRLWLGRIRSGMLTVFSGNPADRREVVSDGNCHDLRHSW
jgi:hypothetical protein